MNVTKIHKLKTVAEGVDTPACLAILWELGVTYAQGYLISEPSGNANFEFFDNDSDEAEQGQKQGKAVFTIGQDARHGLPPRKGG